MKTLQGQTVLVLGLGDSGLAMARWCAWHGATVRVADSRESPPQAAALEGVARAVGFDPALLDGVQRVLKSPGLSPLDAALAPLLARAAELGVPVQGELGLFAEALAELKAERGYAPKLIAITGTNGKTTTTMMCGQLVERSGARVAVAGNVGPTMLATLATALDLEGEVAPVVAPAPVVAAEVVDEEEGAAVEPPADDAALELAPPPPAAPVFEHLPEVWVLELSSFQLDGVQGLVPDAAVVLNVTQDHLDWHGSMVAYAAAKARIYGPADAWGCTMVVNRDDAQVEAMVPPPQTIKAAGRGTRTQLRERKVVRFGLDAPRRPGDYGLVVENGMAWLVRAAEVDETAAKRGKAAVVDAEELHLTRLMPADALRIRGRHNAANALAALALATAIGRPLAPMLHGLREYRGEPHRVEWIATVGGVEAYDDSKGTNVGATVAALDGLGADKAPAKLAVILGGDGKGQDFAPLAAPVARHARAVALIGRDAAAIEAVLAGAVPLARHDSLEAATRWAFEQAQPGDALLLSPACASLDMFRNYAHRAEVFAAAVQALAQDLGEVA
ncbi:MAG TPA: UDP-N-acetylmuramoyl-L-alanine--D-glutamate ligase [Methylibium sp.]|nr:UDP-N-acetylmuramoyl-L-alanine--D-glutamate ligase [Methylibium sp.]